MQATPRRRIAVPLFFAPLLLASACSDPSNDSGGGSTPAAELDVARDWAQWGQAARHAGSPAVVGLRPDRVLASVVVDPFTDAERAETNGGLLAHYQAPLVVGDEVYMAFKGGSFPSCNPPGSGTPAPCGANAWDLQTWSEKRLSVAGSALSEVWSFASDWKPEPDAGGLGRWEPVFHAALSGNFVYVPGLGGTVHKVNRTTGSAVLRLNPFDAVRADTYVAGPLAVDGAGNVFYNVIRLDLSGDGRPWNHDVLGAWLVRLTPDDHATAVAFASLVQGSPGAGDACDATFAVADLPWPPSRSARPPTVACGSQRPGINVAPAIAPDGTIYTVSRAHMAPNYTYLVAVNADLTPRFAASLRGRLHDGCGSSLLPPTGSPGGCRAGSLAGVDPATNSLPAGQATDRSTSSPVVAPDGSILYGAYTRYNESRGHLMRFGADGSFLGSYDFGWDTTPAVFTHDGSYSVVIKENHYEAGSYCAVPAFCPPGVDGPYRITQLSADLEPEWSFTSNETQSCRRNAAGGLDCTSDHPAGFEWCINAPAVDAQGNVYANSEDGNVYVIGQGGSLLTRTFLDEALGAAYTPLSLGRDGKLYTQNAGRLFVLGP